jgi:hypothetical protein
MFSNITEAQWLRFQLVCPFGIVGRNLKNIAPQKQNAICKTRTQYAKSNCAFELFKVNCAATINAKNTSFHKKTF